MSEETPERKTYSGNCHCGAFKFTIRVPELQEFAECSCDTCVKNGYKWIFPGAENFEIVRGEEGLRSYRFGEGGMVHEVCFCLLSVVLVQVLGRKAHEL